VDERRGGLGLTFADLCAVLEEAGRVLLGVPLADSAVCAAALARLGGGANDDVVASIASGATVGTIAFDSEMAAHPKRGWVRLSGTARFVLHGASADVMLAYAPRGDDPAIVLLHGDVVATATRRRVALTDRTRPVALVTIDVDLPASAVLASGERAVRERDVMRAMRATALAAESAGGADAALQMATAYAKERKQFGRLIGSFQAVKHKLASVVALVEHSLTAARYAAGCLIEDEEDFVRRSAIAKAYCGDAFVRASADNIQVHGGIGFTWEHPAHLYFKRAVANAELVWRTVECREHVSAALFHARG